MVVRVAAGKLPKDKLPNGMPLDAINRELREPYFGRGEVGRGPVNDEMLVTTAEGKTLLRMRNWTMAPEDPEREARRRREGLPGCGHLRFARK